MTAMMTNIPAMRVQPSEKKTTPIIAMTASVQVSQVVMYVLMVVPPIASTAWSCFHPAALSRHSWYSRLQAAERRMKAVGEA